jgi:hypothetical protein
VASALVLDDNATRRAVELAWRHIARWTSKIRKKYGKPVPAMYFIMTDIHLAYVLALAHIEACGYWSVAAF